MIQKIYILILILIFTAIIVHSKAKEPHDFSDKECVICHMDQDSSFSSKNGDRKKNKDNNIRRKKRQQNKSSVTQKCLTCHTTLFDEGYMHPVDILPKKAHVPLDFPLSVNGMLTCTTCHDPHASYETPFGGSSNFLRRLETGKAFCDVCHLNSLGTSGGHPTVFREAHFKEKEYTETEVFEEIDPLSRNCLSCHDGSFASNVKVRAGKWKHSKNFLKFDNGGMHPIGMQYEKSRINNAMASLRPISEVDRRIRFFGSKDKIGCGSCHDPFSALYSKLVMSNVNSQLCFGCHKM